MPPPRPSAAKTSRPLPPAPHTPTAYNLRGRDPSTTTPLDTPAATPNKPPAPQPHPPSSSASRRRRITSSPSPSLTDSVSRGPSDAPLSLNNLNVWRKLDLVDECRRRQLPVTGNKPDLRERIMNDIRKPGSTITTVVADDSGTRLLRTRSTVNTPIKQQKKANDQHTKTQQHAKRRATTTATTTSTTGSPSESAPQKSDKDVPHDNETTGISSDAQPQHQQEHVDLFLTPRRQLRSSTMAARIDTPSATPVPDEKNVESDAMDDNAPPSSQLPPQLFSLGGAIETTSAHHAGVHSHPTTAAFSSTDISIELATAQSASALVLSSAAAVPTTNPLPGAVAQRSEDVDIPADTETEAGAQLHSNEAKDYLDQPQNEERGMSTSEPQPSAGQKAEITQQAATSIDGDHEKDNIDVHPTEAASEHTSNKAISEPGSVYAQIAEADVNDCEQKANENGKIDKADVNEQLVSENLEGAEKLPDDVGEQVENVNIDIQSEPTVVAPVYGNQDTGDNATNIPNQEIRVQMDDANASPSEQSQESAGQTDSVEVPVTALDIEPDGTAGNAMQVDDGYRASTQPGQDTMSDISPTRTTPNDDENTGTDQQLVEVPHDHTQTNASADEATAPVFDGHKVAQAHEERAHRDPAVADAGDGKIESSHSFDEDMDTSEPPNRESVNISNENRSGNSEEESGAREAVEGQLHQEEDHEMKESVADNVTTDNDQQKDGNEPSQGTSASAQQLESNIPGAWESKCNDAQLDEHTRGSESAFTGSKRFPSSLTPDTPRPTERELEQFAEHLPISPAAAKSDFVRRALLAAASPAPLGRSHATESSPSGKSGVESRNFANVDAQQVVQVAVPVPKRHGQAGHLDIEEVDGEEVTQDDARGDISRTTHTDMNTSEPLNNREEHPSTSEKVHPSNEESTSRKGVQHNEENGDVHRAPRLIKEADMVEINEGESPEFASPDDDGVLEQPSGLTEAAAVGVDQRPSPNFASPDDDALEQTTQVSKEVEAEEIDDKHSPKLASPDNDDALEQSEQDAENDKDMMDVNEEQHETNERDSGMEVLKPDEGQEVQNDNPPLDDSGEYVSEDIGEEGEEQEEEDDDDVDEDEEDGNREGKVGGKEPLVFMPSSEKQSPPSDHKDSEEDVDMAVESSDQIAKDDDDEGDDSDGEYAATPNEPTSRRLFDRDDDNDNGFFSESPLPSPGVDSISTPNESETLNPLSLTPGTDSGKKPCKAISESAVAAAAAAAAIAAEECRSNIDSSADVTAHIMDEQAQSTQSDGDEDRHPQLPATVAPIDLDADDDQHAEQRTDGEIRREKSVDVDPASTRDDSSDEDEVVIAEEILTQEEVEDEGDEGDEEEEEDEDEDEDEDEEGSQEVVVEYEELVVEEEYQNDEEEEEEVLDSGVGDCEEEDRDEDEDDINDGDYRVESPIRELVHDVEEEEREADDEEHEELNEQHEEHEDEDHEVQEQLGHNLSGESEDGEQLEAGEDKPGNTSNAQNKFCADVILLSSDEEDNRPVAHSQNSNQGNDIQMADANEEQRGSEDEALQQFGEEGNQSCRTGNNTEVEAERQRREVSVDVYDQDNGREVRGDQPGGMSKNIVQSDTKRLSSPAPVSDQDRDIQSAPKDATTTGTVNPVAGNRNDSDSGIIGMHGRGFGTFTGEVETSRPEVSPEVSQVNDLLETTTYAPHMSVFGTKDQASSVLKETQSMLANLKSRMKQDDSRTEPTGEASNNTSDKVAQDGQEGGSQKTGERHVQVVPGVVGPPLMTSGRTMSQTSVPREEVFAPPPSPFFGAAGAFGDQSGTIGMVNVTNKNKVTIMHEHKGTVVVDDEREHSTKSGPFATATAKGSEAARAPGLSAMDMQQRSDAGVAVKAMSSKSTSSAAKPMTDFGSLGIYASVDGICDLTRGSKRGRDELEGGHRNVASDDMESVSKFMSGAVSTTYMDGAAPSGADSLTGSGSPEDVGREEGQGGVERPAKRMRRDKRTAASATVSERTALPKPEEAVLDLKPIIGKEWTKMVPCARKAKESTQDERTKKILERLLRIEQKEQSYHQFEAFSEPPVSQPPWSVACGTAVSSIRPAAARNNALDAHNLTAQQQQDEGKTRSVAFAVGANYQHRSGRQQLTARAFQERAAETRRKLELDSLTRIGRAAKQSRTSEVRTSSAGNPFHQRPSLRWTWQPAR